MELARRGAALVGTSADRVYPSPRGLEIGSGALTQMIAFAAGVITEQPLVIVEVEGTGEFAGRAATRCHHERELETPMDLEQLPPVLE